MAWEVSRARTIIPRMSADPPVNFRPDAFAGTVEDYILHRPPYDTLMLLDMLDRAALPTKGARLIDLACGPGRLTFAIAERFADGVAIDLEPEMIAAARRAAEARGVRHIRWVVGRAEDLKAPAGAFDLVTAASAFHRFDQQYGAAMALAEARRCVCHGGRGTRGRGPRQLASSDHRPCLGLRWRTRTTPAGGAEPHAGRGPRP
jgi:SAM-dependent methyltransferase